MDDTIQLSSVSLDVVRYDVHTGLVPVVVQDAASGQVLMLAYANREALKRTFGTREAWFWSRSRAAYWHKGETSGNVQHVVDVRLDCDGDTVLYLVEPVGPACHTGENTCFYRSISYDTRSATDTSGEASVDHEQAPSGIIDTQQAERLEQMVHSNVDTSIISELWNTLSDRWQNRPQGSYTTFLFEHGVDKVGKKVGEESVEVVIAAKNAVSSESGRAELASESADLLYHLLALWKISGITPEDVFRVLADRKN